MIHFAFVSFLQFFFAPEHGPWWAGAVWGNVVAVIPCGILGVIWAKTKYWPLNLVHTKLDKLGQSHKELRESHKSLHAKLDALHEKHDELHDKVNKLK